jgi:hypothetical protein
VGCETTYAFIYRAAPTGRAAHAASQTPPAFARYNQGSRSSLGSNPRCASPSLLTSPSTPRCESCAAMTTRFLRGLGLVGQGRGRKRRGRWLPRQIDIDQVSDEESGRGRNRPIRSLPVRDSAPALTPTAVPRGSHGPHTMRPRKFC